MNKSATSSRGMVTAPHHLAAQAGLAVLRDGGNAIEATVAAAAVIAVVYPHMNGLGGDGFWLIRPPQGEPVCVLASGRSGVNVSRDHYSGLGLRSIPARGRLAAITVAGTVEGWRGALGISDRLGGKLPLDRLLEDAVHYADRGFPATGSQFAARDAKFAELRDVPGFVATFGAAPSQEFSFKQPRIADTLRRLCRKGLEDFYRGEIARSIASDLARAGSPLVAEDLATCRAITCPPLSLRHSRGILYNTPPPTQGVASLMILGAFDRLGVTEPDGFEHVHGLVEATKQAFLVRDREVSDPDSMSMSAASLLEDPVLDRLAGGIDRRKAMRWPHPSAAGDTVWMGAIDDRGTAVSFIQSLYWEFGSGIVLEESGIVWQNRGASFSLDPASRNVVAARKLPFHTLNPALAVLNDGRVLSYGTMGGDGQPQTQAAILTRYAGFGQDLQAAVTAPRWLLGRTWGDASDSLKLETGLGETVEAALREAGHEVELAPRFSEFLGHAGGVVRHPAGWFEGAADPRSNGGVAAW